MHAVNFCMFSINVLLSHYLCPAYDTCILHGSYELIFLCPKPASIAAECTLTAISIPMQVVVEVLVRRAATSSLQLQPQPYQVLSDFLVSRGAYGMAAAAQLALARRIRVEAPEKHATLAEAQEAYGKHCRVGQEAIKGRE
jgi:hypothetical protein